MLRTFAALVFAIVCMTASLSVSAQQANTTRYVYDDNGRLHAVITPTGEAVVYEYDPAGNIISIQRLAADALALFAFSPQEGLPGDHVTFTGVGIGTGLTSVSFNGATARIISATSSNVVAEVPAGATTGPVTIVTTHGSVTTTTPFTLKGVHVTPSFARVNFGESVQFTAQVSPSTLEQTVQWSVNGVLGGNLSAGTISAAGIYTAPAQEVAPVIVRATSVADSSRFGEAQVQVRNPNNVQTAFAPSVSVSRGENVQAAAVASSLAVQYGGNSGAKGALTKPVSVQFGDSAVTGSALSPRVSVQHGDASGQATAFTNPVSVRYGSESGQTTATSPFVAVTTGPYVSSISPHNLVRGTTVTVTFNGVNLGGATALRLINATTGVLDSSVTVTNLAASADGTSVTATLAIGTGAGLGNRIIVISTPSGDSMLVDVGTNIIQIVSQ